MEVKHWGEIISGRSNGPTLSFISDSKVESLITTNSTSKLKSTLELEINTHTRFYFHSMAIIFINHFPSYDPDKVLSFDITATQYKK